MSTPEHPHEPEHVTVADEVAELVTEALDSAEQLTHTAVKVPFATARLAVEKLRASADAIEGQLRKVTKSTKGGSK